MDNPMKLKETQRAPVTSRRRTGLALVGAGVLLLLFNLFNISAGGWLWPLFVIAPGLLLLVPAAQMEPNRPTWLAYLAMPGAMLVAIGAILFVQNVFDYYESWAYAWALLPAAATLGLQYAGRYQHDATMRANMNQLVRVMLWVFAGFLVFFEAVVFGRLGDWWPVLLVLGGIWLIVRNRRAA